MRFQLRPTKEERERERERGETLEVPESMPKGVMRPYWVTSPRDFPASNLRSFVDCSPEVLRHNRSFVSFLLTASLSLYQKTQDTTISHEPETETQEIE